MKNSSSAVEKTYSLCEAVADIAINFAVQSIHPDDSRELIRLVIEWAEIFEARNKGREWDGEYIQEIDSFFFEQYNEWVKNKGN